MSLLPSVLRERLFKSDVKRGKMGPAHTCGCKGLFVLNDAPFVIQQFQSGWGERGGGGHLITAIIIMII